MVDNYDWLGRYGMLEFLRDVGKHFTIPYMLAKEECTLQRTRPCIARTGTPSTFPITRLPT